MTAVRSIIFIFAFSFLLALVFLFVYGVIAPVATVPSYNQSPFPNISPQNLLSATVAPSSCFDSPKPCTSNTECSVECGDNYECTYVDRDGQYVFNGAAIQQGSYCLPKKNTSGPPECNLFTGRWTWSTDPEYCPMVNDGNVQCWKCLCMYPDLFNGMACVEQVACNNTPEITGVLRGTQYGPYEGQIWDPNSDNSSGILNVNPYSTDENGNPWFTCECASKGDRPAVNLPSDPFSCYFDPCSASFSGQTNQTYLECNGSECSCNCNQEGLTLITNYSSPYFYTCAQVVDICGDRGTLDSESQCLCPYEVGVNRSCKSEYANQKSNYPLCINPKNPQGIECYYPCDPNPCVTGDCIADIYHPNGFCVCPETTTKNNCDKNNPLKSKMTGNKCQNVCIQKGETIATSTSYTDNPIPSMETCTNLQCCNGSHDQRETGFGYSTTYTICN